MASVAITLVPLSGYCIEHFNFTEYFAAMAHCDLLNTKNGALDAPIVLLRASVAKDKNDAVSLDDISNATESTIVETLTENGPDVVRATTENPPKGLAKTHLRAFVLQHKSTATTYPQHY